MLLVLLTILLAFAGLVLAVTIFFYALCSSMGGRRSHGYSSTLFACRSQDAPERRIESAPASTSPASAAAAARKRRRKGINERVEIWSAVRITVLGWVLRGGEKEKPDRHGLRGGSAPAGSRRGRARHEQRPGPERPWRGLRQGGGATLTDNGFATKRGHGMKRPGLQRNALTAFRRRPGCRRPWRATASSAG